MHLIESARRLALAEHKNQKHGKLPYEYHLTAVTGVVSCYTNDPQVIAAAWLHDIIEDCESIDREVIEQMFGNRVADIVDRLSDPPGPRALAKQVSMARIVQCRDASLIKLADRYHNHASTILDRSKRFADLYLAEYDDFLGKFVEAGHMPQPLFENIRGQWRDLKLVQMGQFGETASMLA